MNGLIKQQCKASLRISMSQSDSIDLCVIGCGPTGLAALFEARLLGIKAIGVERASVMSSFKSHPLSTRYISPAPRFEFAGLPLWTIDRNVCKREDVLDYYCRLFAWAKPEVKVGWEWIGLEKAPEGIISRFSTPHGETTLRSRKILFTNWYRRRKTLGDASIAGAPRVLEGMSHPIDYCAENIAVYGGGLSAAEVSIRLMQAGQRIILVTRGPPKQWHCTKTFLELLTTTGSVYMPSISRVEKTEGGIAGYNDAGFMFIPCSIVLDMSGIEVDPFVLSKLVSAGVLDDALAKQITASPSIADILRIYPDAALADVLERSSLCRPDLYDFFNSSITPVLFAGGILHLGAADAGTGVSIATARIAVRAACGLTTPSFTRPSTAGLSQIDKLTALSRGSLDTNLQLQVILFRTHLNAETVRKSIASAERPFAKTIGTIYDRIDDVTPFWRILEISQSLGITRDDIFKAVFYLFQERVVAWRAPAQPFGSIAQVGD